ncbi:hypothetical protein H0H81_006127 [Sphagnurus paluster]|uniref:Uncharacterized protein n=1 Tax=Sphagnurus paluster TaxID=117069 RepID=A0A9P7GLR9_9AGAR|nr:hypothetical protein H0H81_006127 [Sphagnurus paluster]
MRGARVITLSTAWAWAIISASFGLNALIEAHRSQNALKSRAPPPTVLSIDVSDANISGIVLTVGSILVGLLTSNFVGGMCFDFSRNLVNRTLKLQALLLTFCCAWLFACATAFTYIFANRGAVVRAFVNGVELPHSVITALEKASGSSADYKTKDYLRYLAIFPWITLLFTAIAAMVLFQASSPRGPTTFNATRSEEDFQDKGRDVQKENSDV